jgi:16S rRNA (cytidine1402-2'-O)-methyltransferase
MAEPLPPGLYVVATPIGNLGDVGERASATLKGVDLILAEDSRVTGKLVKHIGSKSPIRRYDDHSTDSDRTEIVDTLAGAAVALVSDAGTPLISDPGYKLVRAARASGRAVFTVPGPCAAIAALSIAGLPTDRFLFLGFLPAKSKARGDAIEEVAKVRTTLVLYEAGPRLGETLLALSSILGAREAAIARELTKLHEECVTGTLAELAERYSDSAPKGEIVLVVGPPLEAETISDEELDRALEATMARFSVSRAAADVAQRLGVPRKRAYARALDLSRK